MMLWNVTTKIKRENYGIVSYEVKRLNGSHTAQLATR
jgi:hypothetical protein